MKMIVLGAGIQGGIVSTDLCDRELSPGSKEIVIADYDFKKAKEVGDRLGIKAVECDVSDKEKLAKTIEGADVVINCAQYNWNISIMEACLKAKAHYVDPGGLFHVTRKQFELHEAFFKENLIADGRITARGVCAPEQCVPPLPYFKELEKREMPVYAVEKTPLSSDTFQALNEVTSRPK